MELNQEIVFDGDYASTFHIPGIEPLVLGFLKKRRCVGEVLEIGCGYGLWGLFLKMYVNNSNSCLGLDISRSKLLKVKATNIYDDLVVADVTKLPFRRDSFDTIISIELRTIFNSNDTLINLERLVKRGGLIFLTVAHFPSTLNIRSLITEAYEVHAYFLRGYFLINLTSGNVNVPLSISWFLKRLLNPFLKFALKIKRKPYLIISKIKA
jgi:ubiquinone/menaquinone biosynthesis C-methylase UbiE